MPWLWRQVSNPSAESVAAEIYGKSGWIFGLFGFLISHNATSAKRYRFELFRTGTNETRSMFTVTVPANSTVYVESDEPLIFGIGAFVGGYKEHLKVVAVDGGEPTLTIGLKVRGKWFLVTDMYG
ncbi:MAG: hypothetical protein QW692_03080 [Nitrososphaerota archaeon]